ncbi:MAG: L-aspartate oxidase, partial [Thermodesulfobacteriota bacterium]
SGYYKLKLQMVIDVSILIAKSSLLREESRGVHIREDYPEEEHSWEHHIIITKGKKPSFAPV